MGNYLITGEKAENKLKELLDTFDLKETRSLENVCGYFYSQKDSKWIAFDNIYHNECYVEEFDTEQECKDYLEIWIQY